MDALNNLSQYASQRNARVSDVCDSWDKMKTVFWNPKTTKIEEKDLGYTDQIKSSSVNDIVAKECPYLTDQAVLYLRAKKKKKNQSTAEFLGMVKYDIIQNRKKAKEIVEDAAALLLQSIQDLRTPPAALTEKDFKKGPFGPAFKKLKDERVKQFLEAFSTKKVKQTDFYNICYDDTKTVDDARADMKDAPDAEEILKGFTFHEMAFARQVAIELFDKWGLEQKAIKKEIVEEVKDGVTVQVIKDMAEEKAAAKPAVPTSVEDLENDAKWELYTMSLVFKDEEKEMLMGGPVNTAKMMGGAVLGNLTGFITDVAEFYSWGKPKSGEILFGVGMTYHLKKDGSIAPLDTKYNSAPMSPRNINNTQENELMTQFMAVRKAFKNVGMDVQDDPTKGISSFSVIDTKSKLFNGFEYVDNAELTAEKQRTNALISNWGGITT